jgi:CO/xanthine dehydrogenase Mo-binding subunit
MYGGFGGKSDITVESFLALLTYKTGRPEITYSREESIVCHSKRHYIMEYKTGAKRMATNCTAAKLVCDAGAYVISARPLRWYAAAL